MVVRAREAVLLASVVSALLGFMWLLLVLTWQYPWLLRLAFFITSTLALFGLSMMFLAVYILILVTDTRKGAIQFFPPSLTKSLSLPMFELLQQLNTTVMVPIYNCIRLILLVTMELDEADRIHILQEMNPEFRESMFQQPVLTLLPERIQRLLVGSEEALGLRARRHSRSLEASLEELDLSGDIASGEKAMAREKSGSVHNVLALMRTAEGGSKSAADSSILQKIVAQKVTDNAAAISKQAAAHQLGGSVNSALQVFDDFKEGRHPPQRVLVWIPWTIARLNVKVAARVAYAVVGGGGGENNAKNDASNTQDHADSQVKKDS